MSREAARSEASADPAHDLRSLAEREQPRMVRLRRHLHAHPELSFQEHATAAYIRAELDSLDGWMISAPTPTSVLATRPGDPAVRSLAFRADIDALPIDEESSRDYTSRNPGVMHACGHDGHTAILLGLAHLITEHPWLARGEVRLIFQHAEELYPGGAAELVDAGVLNGVDAVFGLHLSLDDPLDLIGVTPGPFLAGSEGVEITLRGSGGHASAPHTTRDPIVAAASLIAALQTIVARNVDPMASGVVSVTSVHAGDAHNVIASEATVCASVRYFDPLVGRTIHERITALTNGIGVAFELEATLNFRPGYGPVINDPALAAEVSAAVVSEFGERALDPSGRAMASDDIAAMLAAVPGVYLALGARNEAKGLDHPHHHPRFDFDESAMSTGLRMFARILIDIQSGT